MTQSIELLVMCLGLMRELWRRELTENAADKAAADLKQKCDAWRNVVLLSQSQVLCEELRLLCGVVCEAGEVEVGKRSTWEKIASQHLADGLQSEGSKSAKYLQKHMGS